MGYRGTRDRTTSIRVERWSFRHATLVHFAGKDPRAVAGQDLYVSLDLGMLDAEDLYAAARSLVQWAERLERLALAEIDKQAQAPLPGM